MQVIGQNDDGLDSERSTLTGRLEPSPKIVNVFGQEFQAAFQQRDRKKERASRNKGSHILRHDFSLIPLLKAGCASLSRPTGYGLTGIYFFRRAGKRSASRLRQLGWA